LLGIPSTTNNSGVCDEEKKKKDFESEKIQGRAAIDKDLSRT